MKTKQIAIGENLVVNLIDTNFYTRTLNNMIIPNRNRPILYKLIIEDNINKESFSMDFDKEKLKMLADFIYETIGEKK
jgi:hypothetical protein